MPRPAEAEPLDHARTVRVDRDVGGIQQAAGNRDVAGSLQIKQNRPPTAIEDVAPGLGLRDAVRR